MAHYKLLYDDDSGWLYAHHLPKGRDVDVQIAKVTAGEVVGEGGRKARKPVLAFVGKERRLALNRTNGKTVAALYGTDVESWAGKWITLYATTTTMAGEVVDCIRVRPRVPQVKPDTAPPADGAPGGAST